MQTKDRFGKNFLFMMLSVGGTQIINFLIYSSMGRRLSTEYFGLVSLSQAVLVYFSLITLFGVQTVGTREVVLREEKDEFVGEVIALRLGIALFCILIIYFIAPLFHKGPDFEKIMMLFSLTLIPLSLNFDWFFSGIYEMKYIGIYNIIKVSAPFLVVLLLVFSDSSAYMIPIGFFIGLLIAGIMHITVFFRKGYRIRRKRIGVHRLALPFVAGSILATINGNIDTIMIGIMLDNKSLGVYSAAYKIIFLLLGIITAAFGVVYPLLTKAKGAKLEKIISSVIKVSTLLGVPIAIGGFIYANEIITTLFGADKADGTTSLKILMIYFVVLLFRELCSYSLNAWNKEKVYTKIICVSAVGNVIVNIILLPMLGVKGAALATLIWEVYTFIAMRKEMKNRINISYINEIKGVILEVIIVGVIIFALKVMGVNVFITIAVVGGCYLILLYKRKTLSFLKNFKEEE